MKKFHILLVERKAVPLDAVYESLSRNKQYVVYRINDASDAMAYLQRESVDCIILDFAQFGGKQYDLVRDLRGLSPRFQCFVFADTIDSKVMELAKGLRKIMVCGKKVIDFAKEVPGLISRFISGKKMGSRRAKRFQTDVGVYIENVNTGKGIWAKASNMSSTGAFIEFATGEGSVGDVIKVTFRLDEIESNRTVHGELVWISSSAQGKRTAGIRFLSGRDFYNSLLKAM